MVWSSQNQDGPWSVNAQRFNAAGAAQGSQFQVNSKDSDKQQEATVSMSADGTFVITWTNNDSATHTVAFADFNSGQLAPGATYTHKFDTAGAFDYHCSIHPSMTAKVTVQ